MPSAGLCCWFHKVFLLSILLLFSLLLVVVLLLLSLLSSIIDTKVYCEGHPSVHPNPVGLLTQVLVASVIVHYWCRVTTSQLPVQLVTLPLNQDTLLSVQILIALVLSGRISHGYTLDWTVSEIFAQPTKAIGENQSYENSNPKYNEAESHPWWAQIVRHRITFQNTWTLNLP